MAVKVISATRGNSSICDTITANESSVIAAHMDITNFCRWPPLSANLEMVRDVKGCIDRGNLKGNDWRNALDGH